MLSQQQRAEREKTRQRKKFLAKLTKPRGVNDRLEILIDERFRGDRNAFADAMGIPRPTVRGWFGGRVAPPAREELLWIADQTGASFWWLATNTGPREQGATRDTPRALSGELRAHLVTRLAAGPHHLPRRLLEENATLLPPAEELLGEVQRWAAQRIGDRAAAAVLDHLLWAHESLSLDPVAKSRLVRLARDILTSRADAGAVMSEAVDALGHDGYDRLMLQNSIAESIEIPEIRS